MTLRNAFFPCRIGGTGAWSSRGCELFSRNQSHIACQCNHITSFAVLMDISKREVGDVRLMIFEGFCFRGLWFSKALIQSLSLSFEHDSEHRQWISPMLQCVRSALPCDWQHSPPGLLKGASHLVSAPSGCCPYTLDMLSDLRGGVVHSCWS